MITFGAAMLGVGLLMVCLRRIAGAYGAKVHSTPPVAVRIQPRTIERWNLVVGMVFVFGGAIAVGLELASN